MSLIKPYSFNDLTKYTYNATKISLASSYAKLNLISSPGLQFIQNFDNDIDFTYDSDFVEFVAGVMRQKNKQPLNSTLQATFETDKDSDFAAGSTTNSLLGGAAWDSGTIDLTGAGVKRMSMPGAGGNFNTISSAGCIRFKYISNYNALIGIRQIFEYDSDVGNNNMIQMYHNGGNLVVDLRDSAGVQHLMIAGGINFVQFQEYIIEIDFDFNGTSRLFLDGIMIASLNTSPWTRVAQSGSFKWGGVLGGSDYWLDDVILFDAVQHTTDHAGELPYTYYPSIYVGSSVILPETECPGPGTIVSFDAFSAIESGASRYTLQIDRSGDYLYWDGAAWSVSNGTYAQANDSATFNANVATLPVAGAKYGQFKIIFDDSNTISYVDQTICSLTNQIYPVDNPKIIFNDTIRIEELIAFTATLIITGSDNIKFVLRKNGEPYYFNGTAWVVSDESYSKSNTAAEINSNVSTFLTVSVSLQVVMFLHSDDGTTTPQADIVNIEYDFIGNGEETHRTIVWGKCVDAEGNPSQEPFRIKLCNDGIEYGDESQKRSGYIYIVPRSTGYWEIELNDTDNMESGSYYMFVWKDKIVKKLVPEEDSAEYNSLETVP